MQKFAANGHIVTLADLYTWIIFRKKYKYDPWYCDPVDNKTPKNATLSIKRPPKLQLCQ